MKQNHVARSKVLNVPEKHHCEAATKNDLNSKQLYYFKYMPYDSMSSSEKKRYLDSTKGVKSKSTSKESIRSNGIDDITVTKWPSAQHRTPTATVYHAAELSLFYREGPGLRPLLTDRTNSPTKDGMKSKNEDFLREDDSTSSSTNFRSQQSSRQSSRAAFNSTGAGIRNPQEILATSTSNRLLNVISIDQCHIKHRRAGRRMNSHRTASNSTNHNIHSPISCQKQHSVSMGSLIERLTSFEALDNDKPKSQMVIPFVDLEEALGQPELTSSRPETRRERQSRQARQGAIIAGQRHAKRNQLLRDQMDIYLQWCQTERCKEREILAQGGNVAVDSIRCVGKEERLRVFNDLLREQELEFSKTQNPIVVNKSRSSTHAAKSPHTFEGSSDKVNYPLSDESSATKENLLSDMLTMLQ